MASVLRPTAPTQSPILGVIETTDPAKVRQLLLQISSIINHPVYEVAAAFSVQSTLTRAMTLQVFDRRNNPLEGRYAILWYLSATDGGAPGTTQTVGAPTAGSNLLTIAANSVYVSLTDAQGLYFAPITLPGAGSRSVHPAVLGRLDQATGRTATWA